jgi:hypothetical protein
MAGGARTRSLLTTFSLHLFVKAISVFFMYIYTSDQRAYHAEMLTSHTVWVWNPRGAVNLTVKTPIKCHGWGGAGRTGPARCVGGMGSEPARCAVLVAANSTGSWVVVVLMRC